MDSVGEGEGGKIWENGIETCKISCMKKKKKRDAEALYRQQNQDWELTVSLPCNKIMNLLQN